MRILILKTSSLGDIIHTLPALTDAKAAIPDLVVDWAVEEAFAEIPQWHPAVDKVIPVAIRRWRKTPLKTLQGLEWKEFRKNLSLNHYDAIIDAQGLLKSAWLNLFAHGPSHGYDKSSAREPLATLFYRNTHHVEKQLHAVERIRQLLAKSLDYPAPTTKGQYKIDRSYFTNDDQTDNYLVFLHGTTRHDKHWPEAYWQELCKTACESGLKVLLPWGNDHEKERAKRIATSHDNASVLPKLNLAGVAGVIAHAKAVVAVDTGLGHLSAALDIPCISLYGSTQPGLIGAYGENQIHLEAKECPELDRESIDPAVFSNLSPELVWDILVKI